MADYKISSDRMQILNPLKKLLKDEHVTDELWKKTHKIMHTEVQSYDELAYLIDGLPKGRSHEVVKFFFGKPNSFTPQDSKKIQEFLDKIEPSKATDNATVDETAKIKPKPSKIPIRIEGATPTLSATPKQSNYSTRIPQPIRSENNRQSKTKNIKSNSPEVEQSLQEKTRPKDIDSHNKKVNNTPRTQPKPSEKSTTTTPVHSRTPSSKQNESTKEYKNKIKEITSTSSGDKPDPNKKKPWLSQPYRRVPKR